MTTTEEVKEKEAIAEELRQKYQIDDEDWATLRAAFAPRHLGERVERLKTQRDEARTELSGIQRRQARVRAFKRAFGKPLSKAPPAIRDAWLSADAFGDDDPTRAEIERFAQDYSFPTSRGYQLKPRWKRSEDDEEEESA